MWLVMPPRAHSPFPGILAPVLHWLRSLHFLYNELFAEHTLALNYVDYFTKSSENSSVIIPSFSYKFVKAD